MGLFAFRGNYVRTVQASAADAATSKADQLKRPSFGKATNYERTDKFGTPAPAPAQQPKAKGMTKAAVAQKEPVNCPMPEPKPVEEAPKAKRGRPKKSS